MSTADKETTNPFVEAASRSVRAMHARFDKENAPRRRAAYRAVFNSGAGQTVLADIMAQSGLFMSAAMQKQFPGVAADTPDIARGKQDIALWIIQQLLSEETLAKRASKTK